MKISNKSRNEIFYKNGTMKKVYKKAIHCFNDKGVGRPVSWINRRNLEDLTSDVYFLLSSLNLKSKCGNDALRDGKEGEYIKLSLRGVKKLRSLLELEEIK